MAFQMRTSIHGRRLGLSSTGGIVNSLDASGKNSTAFEQAAQMWGAALVETVSSAGASISNSGVTIISSDSTSGTSPFFVAAPIAGIHKEIHIQTPATALALNTTAVSIFFNSSLAEGSSGGSTTLTIAGTAAGIAGVITLRGLSTTQWGVVSHTCASSS